MGVALPSDPLSSSPLIWKFQFTKHYSNIIEFHLLGAGLDSLPPFLLPVTGDLVKGLVAGLMPPENILVSVMYQFHIGFFDKNNILPALKPF